MSDGSWMQIEEDAQLKTYKKFPLSIARGEGVWVETTDGERYLDLYGGHAVVSTGHCHPKVVAAIQKQAGELLFYSNVVYNETRGRAAQALVEVAPEGLENAFFINSGAEANDNALKLARKATGRPVVLAFEGGFHGRTLATLSATWNPKYREPFSPRITDHRFVPFGDLDAVAVAMGPDVAGVIVEPIQSMAGALVADASFYQGLRELCDAHGAMLIYDEIQTGFGRTGEFFFAGRHGVMPDIISLAKGIASGVPMGALLVSDAVAEGIGYGDMGTTFGAGPLASAAMLATIQVIRDEGLLENVRTHSAYLIEQLKARELVEQVHGMGYLLGLQVRCAAADLHKALREHKILTGTSGHPQILRLLPPLILGREEIDHFLAVLDTIEV